MRNSIKTATKSIKDLVINIANIFLKKQKQKQNFDGHWCLIPTILATQEAEIRRIMVLSQLDK
jgi:hypothetical protein